MEIIKAENKKENSKKEKTGIAALIDNIKTIVVTVILTMLFMNYVGQLAVTCGESMANTLHDSNIVLLEKITQRFGELDRYDVIVFESGIPDKPHYIKRIIALPGETIKIDEKGNIFVNNQLLEENYGKEIIKNPGIASTEIVLGENEFFVLGDNRNNSVDSRFPQVGNVHKEQVVGRVLCGVAPFQSVYND